MRISDWSSDVCSSDLLSVLIETMRREGFELAVSRPEVIIKEIDGQQMEPIEQLVVDIEDVHQGGVMEKLGTRKSQLKNMPSDGKGRVRLDYMIQERVLHGVQNEFKTTIQNTGLLLHGDRNGVVAGRGAPVGETLGGRLTVKQNNN